MTYKKRSPTIYKPSGGENKACTPASHNLGKLCALGEGIGGDNRWSALFGIQSYIIVLRV